MYVGRCVFEWLCICTCANSCKKKKKTDSCSGSFLFLQRRVKCWKLSPGGNATRVARGAARRTGSEWTRRLKQAGRRERALSTAWCSQYHPCRPCKDGRCSGGCRALVTGRSRPPWSPGISEFLTPMSSSRHSLQFCMELCLEQQEGNNPNMYSWRSIKWTFPCVHTYVHKTDLLCTTVFSV